MRLFILSRAVLDRMPADVAPNVGDVVAYFREAQDGRGVAREAWAAQGIEVVAAEELVTIDEVRRFEDHFQTALFRWQLVDGIDVTSDGEVSFAALMSPRIKIEYNFLYLVRAGLILKRLVERIPPDTEIVTDLLDGCFTYRDNRHCPEMLLWRRLLIDLAERRGNAVKGLEAVDSLPSYFVSAPEYRLMPVVRSLFQGLRPRQLLSQLRMALSHDRRPRLYAFLQPNLIAMAKTLGVGRAFRVFTNAITGDHVEKVDPGSLWALPGWRLLFAAWRTRGLVKRFKRDGIADPALRWEGIDFSPYVVAILDAMVRKPLVGLLIEVARTRRLARLVRPQAVIVTGDYLPSTLTLATLRKRAGFGMYFVNHGFDLVPCCLYASRMADRGMTYVAEAEAIAPIYGFWLPEAEKPRTVAVTTPVMLPMLGIRGKRRDVRRVLFIGYNSYTPHTATHTAYYDRYLVQMLAVARALRQDGIAVRYRPHPSEVRDNVRRLLELLGDDGALDICPHREFAAALSDCDAVVCNASTCYYQSLFAGWPTIFFEPGDARRLFVGLPADAESGRPWAGDAQELLALIRQAYDPTSAVALFPQTFNGQLAGRYLGRDPERADQVLQGFFESELAMGCGQIGRG